MAGCLELGQVSIEPESFCRHLSCPPRNFRAAADDEVIEVPREPQGDMNPGSLYEHSETGLSVRARETAKPEGLC